MENLHLGKVIHYGTYIRTYCVFNNTILSAVLVAIASYVANCVYYTVLYVCLQHIYSYNSVYGFFILDFKHYPLWITLFYMHLKSSIECVHMAGYVTSTIKITT